MSADGLLETAGWTSSSGITGTAVCGTRGGASGGASGSCGLTRLTWGGGTATGSWANPTDAASTADTASAMGQICLVFIVADSRLEVGAMARANGRFFECLRQC